MLQHWLHSAALPEATWYNIATLDQQYVDPTEGILTVSFRHCFTFHVQFSVCTRCCLVDSVLHGDISTIEELLILIFQHLDSA